MKNKDRYPDMEKAEEAYRDEMLNPFVDCGPYCDFKTWLESEEFKEETDVKKERRDKVNARDEANGYRVSRDPNDSANDWESLRGIDISLRRIADVLEELNERIER